MSAGAMVGTGVADGRATLVGAPDVAGTGEGMPGARLQADSRSDRPNIPLPASRDVFMKWS